MHAVDQRDVLSNLTRHFVERQKVSEALKGFQQDKEVDSNGMLLAIEWASSNSSAVGVKISFNFV